MNAKPDIKEHHTVDVYEASELWARGVSTTSLGQKYHVSLSTIAGLMNRNRDLFPKRTKHLLPDATILAAMLREQSIKGVAITLDVSIKAIHIKLKRAGMAIGNKTRPARVLSGMRPRALSNRPAMPALAVDRVVRVTFTGARVTMPRISLIDGKAC